MAEEKKKKEEAKEQEKQAGAPAGEKAAPAAEAAPEEAKAKGEAKAEAAAENKTETAVAEKKPEKQKPKVQLSDKMEGMIKNIEEMSVLELSDLVKALEEKFGVSAAAPVAAMAAAGAGAPGAAAGGGAEEEKSVFTVVLASVGDKKINVIKEIRAVTDLGLKEAKDLVEAAPKEIKSDVTKEEAEKVKKQLEAAGAKIELK